MENPSANQLPEVDSLPDGFVESYEDPIAPQTTMHNQDKMPADYKCDNVTNVDHSNDLGIVGDLDDSKVVIEQAQNVRSFPVSLSKKDRFDDSVEEAVEELDKGCFKQRECTSTVSDTCSKEQVQVEGQCLSSQTCNHIHV